MSAPDVNPQRLSSESEHPFKRLLHYARPHRKRVWAAATSSVLNKIFDLAPPALIGAAIDVVVEQEDSLVASLGIVDVTHQLIALSALTVIVWGLESAFQYLQEWLWRNLAQTIEHDLRQDAYNHIQNLEMAYFHEQSTGGLMAILNDDINQLERFLDTGADDILQVATTAIVIVTTFFILAPQVAWMAMLPVPIIIWGSFKFQRMLAPRYARVREQVASLNGQLANNLSGIATIKAFATEGYETRRIAQESDDYRQANRAAIRLSAAFSPLIRMAIVLGFTATLLYGGMLAIEGTLAVGVYSVLVFLTQRLLWPLTRLGKTFDLYQRAMASTRRVLNLLATPISIISGQTPFEKEGARGELVFEDVEFAYPDREPILQNFNLRIPAGATLGVVGATGAGKSTLINLLMRFFEPAKGTVRIDGTPLHELRTDDLRRAIGLVSQQTFLFHGTVRENIAYGSFDADDDAILRASRQAEAHPFIEELPRGYDTIVGERGETLSGGQKQRISIARAVLRDPRVLILDEATSAVDNATEAAIQRSMNRLAQDRTMIIIAHRLSTVRAADHIIVMDQGRIIEQGSHDELVALGGDYAALWNIQTGNTHQAAPDVVE
ncbi:ABC transporter ATP-binding protein [Lujinxingia vulgaris]|uniref:ABC transporter ATP-binding protein n=1 Tax=Lujinxingia vulgaris TaxID=2600176 RepID=A0A5C6X3E8_9DELT|nr:ABC transporter ATP-binding protein [Lujinxingia vulgaris]TXD34800.1 ABC transporter ATP-binding protein [Lujinxingia vulgaris]